MSAPLSQEADSENTLEKREQVAGDDPKEDLKSDQSSEAVNHLKNSEDGHSYEQYDLDSGIIGHSAKRVGIVYKHLTVKAFATTSTAARTLPDAILGTFGPDLYRNLCRLLPALAFRKNNVKRTLIDDFTGVVRDGEMLLVLGRPGAGCTTFLKTLADARNEGAEAAGNILYVDVSSDGQTAFSKGEINYLPEDDVHLPDISVAQTLDFVLSNMTNERNRHQIPTIAGKITRLLGIGHTLDTKVGNELVQGVSGGERKRVSIAEVLATNSSILCLDNSTRGLDAGTALNLVKSLRNITNASGKTMVLSLYQASEEIYQQMDQVLLIYDGRCIFQGPAQEAKQYFLDLGFHCPFAQTTADFLTACTDPNERRFRDGYAERTPKSPSELETAFRESESYTRLLAKVDSYEQQMPPGQRITDREFGRKPRLSQSHRNLSDSSPYTVSFARQIRTCLQREFWLFSGDTAGLYTKAYIILAIGLIVGSLFYGASLDSSGAFSRGGALFMSVLFLCWLQLAELMKVVAGLPVIARHREHGISRPSAVVFARVILDLAILLPQALLFAIIMYFLTNLDINASKFWIYSLLTYTTLMTVTALYRMFASLSASIDDAVRFSGIALNLLIIYGGYMIPKPTLIGQYIWFGWLNYLNPLAYSYEAVATNEFANRNIKCNPSQLIPQQIEGAPVVDSAHQVCSLVGSPVNAIDIPGPLYLLSNFGFERSHLWRNFGILIALATFYILVTAFSAELLHFGEKGNSVPTYVHKGRSKKTPVVPFRQDGDLENGDVRDTYQRDKDSNRERDDSAAIQISHSERVLTWENVNYAVATPNGQKQLLNDVSGYCKPGVMIALMGASGAGKTTLLNTLFQRHGAGTVSGEMLVDGRPPTSTFHRSVGFCEQIDLHDNTSTIREALEFSVLLRQDRTIPRTDKIDYVNNIIDLLELGEVQDTLLGSLSLELRKRLAIGVELAAKPSLALFLDEPTSGLDSQSAYSLIHIIRKVCEAGQAVLCTIHQPSAHLMQQFDMILALNPGGNVFYFGPVGQHGEEVIKYFSERGCEPPPQKNVAEFLIETAASGQRPDGTIIDWNTEWATSENAKAVKREIARIKATRSQIPESSGLTRHEFAASTLTQTVEVTRRLFRQYWRDPSYLYSKLFASVLMGIFNGFTFWQLGNSLVDLQNRMFSVFLIVTIPAIIVNGVIPKFFHNMMLWMAREHPSRIYGWFAFSTAQILGEIPVAIVGGIIYWALWYWAVFAGDQRNTTAPIAGYVFFMTILMWLFMASWGQWIVSFAPSFTVISNLFPLFSVMTSLFNGIMRPYSSLPVFWRYTMYYVNPTTYWINGILAAVLPGVPVDCTDAELLSFTTPPGLTCSQYASAYAAVAGGNLTNSDSTTICTYCPLRNGEQYLANLQVSPHHQWRNLGIFTIFVLSNYALVYFFIYTVRIRGWKFGMGLVFGTLGRGFDVIVNGIRKTVRRTRQELIRKV